LLLIYRRLELRFPNENEDLAGKVCVCSAGRIGVVSGAHFFCVDHVGKEGPGIIHGWGGVGFDGKGTWFSTQPVVAYESVEEYREVLRKRFGGKMSYNG
jgi:hypothetical protein